MNIFYKNFLDKHLLNNALQVRRRKYYSVANIRSNETWRYINYYSTPFQKHLIAYSDIATGQ